MIFRELILSQARWIPPIRMRLTGRNVHGRIGIVVEEGAQRAKAAVVDEIREAISGGVNGGTKSI